MWRGRRGQRGQQRCVFPSDEAPASQQSARHILSQHPLRMWWGRLMPLSWELPTTWCLHRPPSSCHSAPLAPVFPAPASGTVCFSPQVRIRVNTPKTRGVEQGRRDRVVPAAGSRVPAWTLGQNFLSSLHPLPFCLLYILLFCLRGKNPTTFDHCQFRPHRNLHTGVSNSFTQSRKTWKPPKMPFGGWMDK